MTVLALLLVVVFSAVVGCQTSPETSVSLSRLPESGRDLQAPAFDRIERDEFNRKAVRLNAPIFWFADHDHDGAVDPDEVAALLFYETDGNWVDGGEFTTQWKTA